MSAPAEVWLAMYAARDRAFGVLSEAQWRVLLDLYQHGKPLPVTSCCIASSAPHSTAARHIGELVEAQFLVREQNATDRRFTMLELSEPAKQAFARFFDALGQSA